MAVFRIEKTRDYTVMANHHLRNTALSLKAKGLLSLMLSLPEDWDYTTKGLARICRRIGTKAATSEAFNNASKNVHPDLDLPSSVLGGRPSADGPAGPFRLLYNQHIYFATRRNTVQKNFMLRIVHPCCNPTSVRSARWASGTAPGGGPCKPIRF